MTPEMEQKVLASLYDLLWDAITYSPGGSKTNVFDKQTSFVPSLYNPALGTDPCNGLMVIPDNNPCAAAGFRGGTAGPNRSLQETKYDAIAPRLGIAFPVGEFALTLV